MSADPVSWLLIERGWHVVDAAGERAGHIAAVDGEAERDIFDGLEVRLHVLGHAVYVPSEEVAEIVPGQVRLTISCAELTARPQRPS